MFFSLPIPSISLSNTSPGLRYSAGFLCIPTPAGVPVRIISPGYSVTILKIKNYPGYITELIETFTVKDTTPKSQS